MYEPKVSKDFCKQILELDKTIRFAGIADIFGKIAFSEYRRGTIPLVSNEELALYAIQTSIRMGSRKTMQARLGKLLYAFALFEKVKTLTILLDNQSLLLVSFDIKAKHEPIILKKILPLLRRHDRRRD